MKLKTRLLASLLAVALTGVASSMLVVTATASRLFRGYVQDGDREKAAVYAQLLGRYYAGKGSWEGLSDFLAQISPAVDTSVAQMAFAAPAENHGQSGVLAVGTDRIVVADATGLVIADTAGLVTGSQHPARHLDKGLPVFLPGTDPGATQGAAQSIAQSAEPVGRVLVGSMVDSALSDRAEAFLRDSVAALAAAAIAPALAAIALGLLLADRLSRSTARLATASAKVAAGDFAALVEPEGPDEFKALTVSFNTMARDLERLENSRRRLIADSAHELRTPVTLLKGGLEAMLDGVYPRSDEAIRSLLEETSRLSRLIDSLRELELIDSGKLPIEIAQFDPAGIVAETGALFSTIARERGLHLEISLSPPPGEVSGPERTSAAPALCRADPQRTGQALRILLDNACKYVPKNGLVRVSLRTGLPQVRLAILVEDSGGGVPEADRETIFERFVRLDAARISGEPGQGLGLPIAREIARAQGGDLYCLRSETLGGAAFWLELPGAQS